MSAGSASTVLAKLVLVSCTTSEARTAATAAATRRARKTVDFMATWIFESDSF